jgi:hypothetical protein
MGLRREIMELLREGRQEELVGRVRAEPRALRHLRARLYDADASVRRNAARALGEGAAAHRELGLETVRHLLWALNDESATNGVYGIPALGEIGGACPDRFAPFLPTLVAAAEDDGLRLAVLEAVTRIAEGDAELVRPHLDRLAALCRGSSLEERRALRRLEGALGTAAGEEEP